MVKFLSSIQFQRAEWNSRMRTFSNHLAGYWLEPDTDWKPDTKKLELTHSMARSNFFSGEINQFIILDQNKIYKRKNPIGQWVYRKWKSADYQSLERL